MRIATQQSVCEWNKVQPQPPVPNSKLGIALSTLGKEPIHGLRIATTDTTNGWYIWCGGEMSQDPEFLSPIHVEHLSEYLPAVVAYLDLPPGHRFLIDVQGYEDVWFDASLLEAE